MQKFQPVLELLLNKSIKDFQNAFGEDYGSTKGISYDDFYILITSKLCLDVKKDDVHHLFCQIDRYSNGSITSEDLDAYLCEYEKKRMITTEGPFETTPTMYPGVRSQDSIIKWILCPEDPEIANETAGDYFFVSRSGHLSVLNKDMERRFETSIETCDDEGSGKVRTWATSLTYLSRERLLAVATTSGDIRFFRSSIYKFEHKFTIVYLPYIVLELDSYASEKLICGDFYGSVFIIQISKTFFSRIRNRASHLGPEKILFDYLKIGKYPGMSYEGADKLHFSPIQKVAYIPSLMAVISCSLNTKRAMMVHHLKNNESLVFVCQGGIMCFDFCEKLNCIVTGGADYTIKRWNPNASSTYNESLTGHTSPVNHVLVFEKRQLLISADREKVIRVWDLLRPQCLQIIKFKEMEFPGKQGFSFAFLDPTNGNLILTTYNIGKLKFNLSTFRDKTHPCSEYIILAAYSNVYKCLVTVGNASTIATWDAESGSLIYEFEKSHTVFDSFGMPHNMGALVAGLDPSERRLITADRKGTVKVWNFHLGVCLKSFDTNCTILALSFTGYHIYAAGSSRVVIDLYDSGPEKVDPVIWDKRHSKTIVSLDCYGRDLLASATGYGEIIIWLRRSTDAKIQMKDLKEDETDAKVDDDYRAKREIEKKRKCSISQMLFLQTREVDFFVGNLVSCGSDGRIRFWNVVCKRKVNEGKLLSKFKAVFGECHGILCLATDAENLYLISGDTMGYVRVYDLNNYYDKYGSAPSWKHKATPLQLEKFPFLKLLKSVDQNRSKYPDESEVGCMPFLLNCFRAHLEAVLKVSYASGIDTLITAGRDSSVRLWNISGMYIGRLGPSDEPWGLVKEREKSHMPPDVKSVASSFTLFVTNNGTMPLWARAMTALKKCRLGNQPEDFSEKPLKWTLKKSQSAEQTSGQDGTIEEDLAKRLSYFQATEGKFLKT